MRKKVARWLLIGAAAGAIACLLIVGVANLLIQTDLLEGLLSKRPVKFRMGWQSAWTLKPGRFHVDGFFMAGQARTSQWRLEIEHAVVDVRLAALLRKTFHAEKVQASGLTLRVRRQRVPGEEAPANAALEPIIEGMPDLRPPLELLEPRPKRRFPWVIWLEDVDAEDVRELWIMAYRLTGGGQAAGSLVYTIGGDMALPAVSLDLPAAQVHTGDESVGTSLLVHFDGDLAPCAARGLKMLDFIRHLKADVVIHGEVADFGFLNYYFAKLPSLRLRGAGVVAGAVELDRGSVSPGGRVDFDSNRMVMRLKDYEIGGRGGVAMWVDQAGRTVLDAVIADIGVAGGGTAVAPTSPIVAMAEGAGCGLTVHATSSLDDPQTAFSDLSVSLRIPECRLSGLSGLNAVLPDPLPLRFGDDSGATLEAGLDLNEFAGEGDLLLKGTNIDASLMGLPMEVDAVLELDLESDDPATLELDASGSRLRVENVSFDGGPGRSGRGWWIEAMLEDASIRMAAPLATDARVEVRMRDTGLLTAAFVPEGQSNLLAGLLDLEDLVGRARVRLSTESFEILDLEISGQGLGRQLVGGEGSEVTVRSDRVDLGAGFEGLAMDAALPVTEISDLGLLNRFIPETLGLAFESGSVGTLQGTVSVRSNRLTGSASVRAEGAGLQICELPILADIEIDLKLPAANLDEQWIELSGSSLHFHDVLYTSRHGGGLRQWNADLRLEEGRATFGDHVGVEGRISGRLSDTRALLAAFVPETRHGLNLEDLLDIEDVAVQASFEAGREALTLTETEITGRGTAGGRLKGPGFQVAATSVALDVEHGFTDLDMTVELPPSEIVDLAAFNPYIPERSGLAFQPQSSGMVSASLVVENGLAVGAAEVRAERIGLDLGQTSMVGDLSVQVQLNRGDLATQSFDVGGSAIRIEEAPMPGSLDAEQSRWWARVDISRGLVELGKPIALDTAIYLEMGDSGPLIGNLTGEGKNSWLEEILSFNEVAGSVKLALSEEALTIGEVEIRGLGRAREGIVGPGLSITASGRDINLERGLEGLDLVFDLPRSEVRDLSVFNRYLPEAAGVSLLPGGSGTVGAHLELASGRGKGYFELTATGFGATVGGTTLSGDMDVNVLISAGDLEDLSLDLVGSRVRLDGVRITGAGGSVRDDWWAEGRIKRGVARMELPLDVSAEVELQMSDTWPLVSVAAEKSWIVRLFKGALDIDRVLGRSIIELDEASVLFEDLEIRGDRFEAEGRMRLSERGSDGILYVSFRGLSLGVLLDGEERTFKLLGSRKWYEEQEPLVRLAP